MVDEAGKSLDEMEGEARSAPLQFRAEMLANVRKYRSSVTSLQSQLNKARVVREGGGRGVERGGQGGERGRRGMGARAASAFVCTLRAVLHDWCVRVCYAIQCA